MIPGIQKMYPMRQPCRICSHHEGRLVPNGPHKEVRCAVCDTHGYFAPRSEWEPWVEKSGSREGGEMIYISECCDALPLGELDMTTVQFGGPSGFCGICHDNCIFVLEERDENQIQND